MPLNDPTKLRRRVGARIAALRTSRGWTQEQLAEKLEVSTRYLQAVEAGQENLTLDSLAKFGNALRARAATFFTEPLESSAPRSPSPSKRGGSRHS